jgi:hypothetical protein
LDEEDELKKEKKKRIFKKDKDKRIKKLLKLYKNQLMRTI